MPVDGNRAVVDTKVVATGAKLRTVSLSAQSVCNTRFREVNVTECDLRRDDEIAALIDGRASRWLYVVALVCIWNALKFIVTGPVSVVSLVPFGMPNGTRSGRGPGWSAQQRRNGAWLNFRVSLDSA